MKRDFVRSIYEDPAAFGGKEVTLGGEPLSKDQPAVIENGRTLVPLRAIIIRWDYYNYLWKELALYD